MAGFFGIDFLLYLLVFYFLAAKPASDEMRKSLIATYSSGVHFSQRLRVFWGGINKQKLIVRWLVMLGIGWTMGVSPLRYGFISGRWSTVYALFSVQCYLAMLLIYLGVAILLMHEADDYKLLSRAVMVVSLLFFVAFVWVSQFMTPYDTYAHYFRFGLPFALYHRSNIYVYPAPVALMGTIFFVVSWIPLKNRWDNEENA